MKTKRGITRAVVLSIIFMPLITFGQTLVTIEGRVTQSVSGEQVAFATVVAMQPDSTVAGAAVAGEDGFYSLKLAPGLYLINVGCIGYLPYGRMYDCYGRSMELDFELDVSATDIGEVSVRAPKITREADRFVMNVAGTLEAVGRNAEEFLKTAPAVWIKDDKILVDGRAGAQIIVNERILNMSDEETVNYLRTINAEDIARVEIIPRAGADYDASASGGIIKITLRKKRDAGLEISPWYRSLFAKEVSNQHAGFSLNYRIGKLTVYSQVNNSQYKHPINIDDRNYTQNMVTESITKTKNKSHDGGGRIGMIYDIGENQSVGVEYSYSTENDMMKLLPVTSIYAPDIISIDSGRYFQDKDNRRHYAALNYILRLDSVGSVFKVIADLSRTNTTGSNLFENRHRYMAGNNAGTYVDTLYRNDPVDRYLIATAAASLEQVISDKSRLMTGLKFIYTSLDDDSRYYGHNASGVWELDRNYSIEQRYTEKIAAAYATFSSAAGPVKILLGLRGEYTHATPVTSLFDDRSPEKNRNTYFSLFPNVNVSLPLSQENGHSISAFYARKINRPGYWALNPFRIQLSEYSYIIGDPMLKPTFINETGLNLVIKHKYSFTAGYRASKDRIEQYVFIDPDMPDVTVYKHANMATEKNFYVSVNLPVDITEKISLNSNLYYVNSRLDPGNGGYTKISNNLMANAVLNVTLPRSYRVELNGWYTNTQRSGNMEIKPMGDINIGIRKRFFKDALSASVELRNVLCVKNSQKMVVNEENFSREVFQNQSWNRRGVALGLQYNFKTGKKANGRRVERGGDESR